MFPSNTRIMIVEDAPAMLEVIKNSLKGMGFSNFVGAANGKLAFQQLKEQAAAGQPVELVLADWNMPEMNGLELLVKVRQTPEFRSIPYIMITAESERFYVIMAIKAQVSNFIVKPFTDEDLKSKLTDTWNKINSSNPNPA